VLQVNYRGSTGFGEKFANAGNREWGTGKMQHDLTDSVRWAIEKGIADPKKVWRVAGCVFVCAWGGGAFRGDDIDEPLARCVRWAIEKGICRPQKGVPRSLFRGKGVWGCSMSLHFVGMEHCACAITSDVHCSRPGWQQPLFITSGGLSK
jgi:hypothetical protein